MLTGFLSSEAQKAKLEFDSAMRFYCSCTFASVPDKRTINLSHCLGVKMACFASNTVLVKHDTPVRA